MSTNWREIRTNIEKFSDKYLLAVSGGADSMFMLDFFSRCNVQIEVVHYNHKMRETSDREEYLVQDTCLNLGIPFYANVGSNLSSSSDELQARDARWTFIESIAKSKKIFNVVTGHHADDNIENIFIRLMRGDSHDSLTMQEVYYKNDIVRYKPFLNVFKKEIYEQCERKNVRYIEDDSNQDLRFDRNFIRNVIIPAFNERTNIRTAMMTGIKRNGLH